MGRAADDRATNFLPAEAPVEYWEPDHWGPRHELAARMHGAGLRNYDIAAALGVSEGWVSVTICDRRAKAIVRDAADKIADNIEDLHTQLKHHATEALREIVDQMRSAPKTETRQRAALAILDRAGYTPVQRHSLVAPPELPASLTQLVAETHEEMRLVRSTTRYALPAGAPPEAASEDAA